MNQKSCNHLSPKMNGDEERIQDLINVIALYEWCLDDSNKQMLKNFVVKNPLTSRVKMRLVTSCITVDLLLGDMHTHLLTSKSDTALLCKLRNNLCKNIEPCLWKLCFRVEIKNSEISERCK